MCPLPFSIHAARSFRRAHGRLPSPVPRRNKRVRRNPLRIFFSPLSMRFYGFFQKDRAFLLHDRAVFKIRMPVAVSRKSFHTVRDQRRCHIVENRDHGAFLSQQGLGMLVERLPFQAGRCRCASARSSPDTPGNPSASGSFRILQHKERGAGLGVVKCIAHVCDLKIAGVTRSGVIRPIHAALHRR